MSKTSIMSLLLPSTLPQSLVDRVTFRRIFIRQHGTSVKGTSEHHSPQIVPKWFDVVAFAHAQAIYHTFSSVIGLSKLYGLILGILHYPALAPLIATGQSKTMSSLFLRYLSTNVHIRQWFTGGSPFDKNSPSYRSLKIIRGLHLQVSIQLNKLSNGMSLVGKDSISGQFGSADLWISQWSMMHAQFAFIGFPIVFPEVLGFGTLSAYDRHCLLHFWRTIGYCLGIEDRFNLCTGSTDEEVVELCRQIYYLEWKPAIEKFPEAVGQALGKDIALIMFCIIPIFTYRALMRYVAPTFGLDSISAYQLKTTADYFYYGLLSFILKFSSRNRFLMKTCSVSFTLLERLAFWGKDVHSWILNWWYPEKRWYQIAIDQRCPFSVTGSVNYKAAWQHQLK